MAIQEIRVEFDIAAIYRTVLDQEAKNLLETENDRSS